MRTIQIGTHKLEIYDSIDELPVVRFHKYNKFLLIDSGVGSDLNDVNSHIERAMVFCKTNPDHAIKELNNLRQSIHLIMMGINTKHMAFCTLVKSIDGKEFTDLSDEGIKNLLKRLDTISHKEVTAHTEAVKKKIDSELNVYFPGTFEDSTIKEYFDQLRKRTMLILETIITGENKAKEIEELTDYLISFTPPMNFSGTDSMEISYDKQFENMCLIISQKLNVDPKKMTVLEYYNSFEFLKKQMKPVK